MDYSSLGLLNQDGGDGVDIFEIYQRYCDIRARSDHAGSREPLAQLLKLVESRGQTRNSVSYDLPKLMSYLNNIVDSNQFACFYEFVFFINRENGQKSISVSRATAAWRLVLAGRFRLLNHWCDFVEKHKKHNISEDTWQQVLAFSRCVNEDLGGYDPRGAWPVLIDDFVEHMYRIMVPNDSSGRNLSCSPRGPEAPTCIPDDTLPGLKVFSGSKRKFRMYCDKSDVPPSAESSSVDSMDSEYSKRSREATSTISKEREAWEGNPPGNDLEMVKQSGSLSPNNSAPCAVESSLAMGFAGLLTTGSCSPLDKKNSSSLQVGASNCNRGSYK
ncbi:hypothetical protein MKX01_030850 [Papaver californicum]|nr:hypothetical protein MKX01_030850 [Papaver californicum]